MDSSSDDYAAMSAFANRFRSSHDGAHVWRINQTISCDTSHSLMPRVIESVPIETGFAIGLAITDALSMCPQGGIVMPALPERIRRARALSRTSQLALAQAVGVQRSAVAQWERRDGSSPSMHHLIAIATVTGVCLEWLGTGRGLIRPEQDEWTLAMQSGDYAQDDLEEECLASLRKLPFQLRKQLVATISLVAKNASGPETKRPQLRPLMPLNEDCAHGIDTSAAQRQAVVR
ncbi:helix-turn-helix transcriptional regulator [Lysobacter sp. CA199]|uniref:helix-turn-helix transcriptional regulator n=1 Tax=Lysobacter sp. CA199 TaxID=3455608 RepID=UPI003F8D19F8